MSALEDILQAIVAGGDPATLLPPGSRGEVLLQAVLNKVRATDQTVGGHTTQLEQKANKAIGDFVSATLLNTWTGTIEYQKNDVGMLVIKIDVVVGTGSPYTQIAVLPEEYRPPKRVVFHLWDTTAGDVVRLFIENGEIRNAGATISTGDALSGVVVTYVE